jgi:hypothetical protein
MMKWMALAAGLISSSPQPASLDFRRLSTFVGSWKGQDSGVPGEGTGDRTCRLVLGDNFLLCENTSTYPPQEKNPKGEVHQDWTLFSYDAGRDRFVARQFNIERFVNQLVMDAQASSEDRWVFVSESSENTPEGTRVRLTYVFQGEDRFEETFEVGWPGKELEVYVRNRWTRAASK